MTDAFSRVVGAHRGADATPSSALAVVRDLCAAAVAVGDETLRAFVPSRPVPSAAGIAALTAMGANSEVTTDRVRACEIVIGTWPGLDKYEHRHAVAALCDAAYARLARPHLNAATYAACVGPARELLGPNAC